LPNVLLIWSIEDSLAAEIHLKEVIEVRWKVEQKQMHFWWQFVINVTAGATDEDVERKLKGYIVKFKLTGANKFERKKKKHEQE